MWINPWEKIILTQFTENILEAPDDELVCWCAGVPAGAIRAAVANGARTMDDIRTVTGACIKGDCKKYNPRGRCCSVEIVQFLPQKNTGLEKFCGCSGK